LILSAASVFGADAGIHVVSTVKTNAQTASISAKDVFTRDGQTNLVRTTQTRAGSVQICIHRFYHAGRVVADFVATSDSSGLTTKAGSPYSLTLEFGPSKEPKSAVIGSKDGVVLDAFGCTNGVFYPADASRIQQVNDLLQGTVNGEQIRDPEQWVKQYKQKNKIP
jgi:hypothetical protein